MFYDMAILVEEQGEMIVLIEYNVELVAAHVEADEQNIHRVAEYSRSKRRVSGKLICSLLLGIDLPSFPYGVAPLDLDPPPP